MKLIDLLEHADYRNLRFGLHPSITIKSGMAELLTAHLRDNHAETVQSFAAVEHYPLIHTPPDAQTFGSCAFNAFTGLLEIEIFRATKRIVQLDYDRLYADYRHDNGLTDDCGAMLEDPFWVARSHGLIPPTTRARRVHPRASDFCAAMRKGPLCIGISIHPGWAPSRLHPQNGAVDESLDRSLRPNTNGHAMLCIGTNLHNSVPMLVLRQSWGPIGYRNAGLTAVSFEHYLRWMIDTPLSVEFGPDWPAWRGWEAYALPTK